MSESFELLTETGVSYTRNAKDAARAGLHLFSYHWATPNGETGEMEVYCHSRADLLELINHWNRPGTMRYWV